MTKYSTLIAYVSLVLVMLLWAGNSIVGRAIRDDVAPFTLAFVRWLGAFALLAPFAIKHVVKDSALLQRNAGIVLLLGVLGVGAFNALLYTGLHHTTATNGLLMQAAIPPLVLVFNALFFAERAGAAQIGGVTLAALGVVLIVVRADLDVLLHFTFGFGDLLILCAVVTWALYTSLLRLRPDVHPLSFLAVHSSLALPAWRHWLAMNGREAVSRCSPRRCLRRSPMSRSFRRLWPIHSSTPPSPGLALHAQGKPWR